MRLQLPIYEAIKALPRLLNYTQIRAQISGATGQNAAQADAANEGKESAKPSVNGGVWRVVTQWAKWSERRDSNPRHSRWQRGHCTGISPLRRLLGGDYLHHAANGSHRQFVKVAPRQRCVSDYHSSLHVHSIPTENESESRLAPFAAV